MKQHALFLALTFALTLANTAWGHGNLHKEIADITELLAASPDDASLYYKRGRLHLEHNDWAPALEDLGRARHLDPELLEVDYHLARAHFGAGRRANADRVLQAYLERLKVESAKRNVGGAQLRGYLLHGRVLKSLGQSQKAATAYERSVAMAAEPQPAQFLEWSEALTEVNPVEALAVLEKGIEKLGSLVTLELAALELEVAQDAPAAAIARLDRLVESTPQPAAHLHRRGQLFRDAGCPEEAGASFRSALEALDEVPAQRRKTRALMKLETAIRDDLGALPAATGPCPLAES